MTATDVKNELKNLSDPVRAKNSLRFFKTGPGEYGEGDKFIGVTVPDQRKVARQFLTIDRSEIKKLLESPIHEHRLTALIILTERYKQHPKERKNIFDFYLKNYAGVNNWDLVDTSAHKIVGAYLTEHPEKKSILAKYAKSKNLWERRLSMIATLDFIQHNEFEWTLKNAEALIGDKHDLTHKAVGWMLREAWKRNHNIVENFLNKHIKHLPRTTLRYAIERMEEKKRKAFLVK